jgi:hypothetical protein
MQEEDLQQQNITRFSYLKRRQFVPLISVLSVGTVDILNAEES